MMAIRTNAPEAERHSVARIRTPKKLLINAPSQNGTYIEMSIRTIVEGVLTYFQWRQMSYRIGRSP